MSNEGMYKMFMGHVARIERAVENGQEGLCELRELWQEVDDLGVGEQITAEKIVGALKADVKDVLLKGFIENFCE